MAQVKAPKRSSLCRVDADYGCGLTLLVYLPFLKADKYLYVCWTHEQNPEDCLSSRQW